MDGKINISKEDFNEISTYFIDFRIDFYEVKL